MNRTLHTVMFIASAITLAEALYIIGTAHTWHTAGVAILGALLAAAAFVWLCARWPDRR